MEPRRYAWWAGWDLDAWTGRGPNPRKPLSRRAYARRHARQQMAKRSRRGR